METYTPRNGSEEKKTSAVCIIKRRCVGLGSTLTVSAPGGEQPWWKPWLLCEGSPLMVHSVGAWTMKSVVPYPLTRLSVTGPEVASIGRVHACD